jgi:polyglycine hydrolase-like protein
MSITRRRTLGFATALAALGGAGETGLASVLRGTFRNTETAQCVLVPLIHRDESRSQPHSAIVSIPARDSAWYAINTLAPASYARLNKQFKTRGYRLKRVSAFHAASGTVYAAIWERANGPEWHSRHGLSLNAFNRAHADFSARGWRMTHVDARAGYSAIWEHTASQQQTLVALSQGDFEQRMAELSGQGFRPAAISTGVANAASAFTAVFEKDSTPWHYQHMLTADQFARTNAQMRGQGLRLVDAAGHMIGRQPTFAGLWEKI